MPLSYLRSYNKNMTNADNCPLLSNLNQIHTTPMGSERIRKNLSLGESITDVVDFCKKKISSSDCKITRQGKNWYCEIDGIYITVNAYSYTIITAHPHPVVECPRSGCIETTSTKRPPFAKIKSFAEFFRYYWYRDELQTICKSLNIDASGMKADLNHNIEEYFKGNFIPPKKSNTIRLSVTKHRTYAKYDKVSLQWNKFVHDFCADPATTHFKNKLKTASILWKEVRTSTREKIYKTELLKEFSDIINKEN